MKKSYRSKYRPEFPGEFYFDYKDPVTLGRFLMEDGKVVPSRISKLSQYQQRQVAKAVKRARSLALLPVGNDAFDHMDRPEPISPRPFALE